MNDTERTYTIPLRSSWLKAPKYRRSKRAVSAVKSFLVKHMKCKNVRLGQKLNEFVWERGIKNPPSKVKVNVKKTKKDEEDIVYAELYGEKLVLPEKPKEKKGLAEKLGFKEEKEEAKEEAELKSEEEEKREERKKAKHDVEKEKEKMLEKAEEEREQHEAEEKAHEPEKDPSYKKTPAKNKQFKEQYEFHR